MTDDRTFSPLPDESNFDSQATTPFSASNDDNTTQAMGNSSVSSEMEQPGTMIGHYKLLRILGEGGFGTVYLAEQLEPVKRNVALKIIKLGMDTKEVIARFAAEKQALALMDHPGIAKVFDAGSTDTGRPYFVMELVDGLTVTEYCDRKRMRTRQRLELFGEICSAVQHAHQKGVIHRDIKPSNVLVSEVGGRPVPKVIDFGIAKATEARLTEKTIFTLEAQFIGTPAYMSPEQTGVANLDVDTRSDIYSLGVLLYELLSGVTPFDQEKLRSAGYAEIQRIIREDDPPQPSTRVSHLGDSLAITSENRQMKGKQLVKRLKGELDWIILKCIEKDRSRRYETANGLARDIDRYLSDEPVFASPPSRTYRLKKLVVRNRTVFAAGMAMVLLLAAGVVGTSVGLVRARLAEKEAVSEASKSTQVAAFLTDMLAGVGPSAARGRDTEMLEEILLETDKSIGEELSDQPEVEGEIRSHLGQTYFDLGRLEKSKEQYILARGLLTDAHGEQNADVARQYSNLGLVHEALQEYEASEINHLKALELRREIFDDVHEDLAMTLVNIANLYVNISRYKEAEPLMHEGLEQLRQLHGEEDEELAICLNSLGNLMQHLKRYDEARPYYEEALAMHTSILGDDHPYVITDMSNLGWLAMNTGNLNDASKRFEQAASLSRRVYTEPNPNLIYAINAQATVEQKLKHFESAESLFRECITLAEELYGPEHSSTADNLLDLAECLTDMERISEADEMTQRALAIHEKTFGPEHPTTLRSCYNYAYSVYNRGDYEEAIPLLKQSVAAYTKAVGRDHKNTALALSNLGRALRDDNQLDEAIIHLTETQDIRNRILGPDHLLAGVSDHDLAKALYFQGHFEKSDASLASALTVYTATLDSTHRVFGSILNMMARIDLDLGRPQQALDRLADGRLITLMTRSEEHLELLDNDVLEGVARGRLGEIDLAMAKAARVELRLAELKPLERARYQLDLGRIYTMAGQYEKAEHALLEAHSTYNESNGEAYFMTQQTVRALSELKDAQD